MEAQGKKVMRMFAEIVRDLDQPEDLVRRWRTSAGVTWTTACRILSTTRWASPCSGRSSRALGPAFTPSVRDAWTEAYLYVSSVLRRATTKEHEARG